MKCPKCEIEICKYCGADITHSIRPEEECHFKFPPAPERGKCLKNHSHNLECGYGYISADAVVEDKIKEILDMSILGESLGAFDERLNGQWGIKRMLSELVALARKNIDVTHETWRDFRLVNIPLPQVIKAIQWAEARGWKPDASK